VVQGWRTAALGCALGFGVGYLVAAFALRTVESAPTAHALAAAAGLLLGLPSATVLVQLCRTVYQRPILERLDERTYAAQNRRAALTRVIVTLAGGVIALWGLPAELGPLLVLGPPAVMGAVLGSAGWYLRRVFQPGARGWTRT
jgi:hypothetical protein